jgi:hypothetical protein
LSFTRKDFESGSTSDVWQIAPTGGSAVVGPITLQDGFLIVHEYREAWNCRVHHEIPYDHIARRMQYPADVAAAVDAPSPGKGETAGEEKR